MTIYIKSYINLEVNFITSLAIIYVVFSILDFLCQFTLLSGNIQYYIRNIPLGEATIWVTSDSVKAYLVHIH